MKRLVLAEIARADLASIRRYSTRTWGRDQTTKYMDALRDTMKGLLRGTVVTRARDDLRPAIQMATSGRHSIFFEANEFVAGRPHCFYEAPLGANPSIVDELASALGQPLRSGLTGSTDCRSRIIWPPALEGRDLFVYSPESRPPGALNRMKDLVVPLVHSELSYEVMRYLDDTPGR